MQQALALGERVRRLTPPNPWVGAVIVRDGVVVGEGATEPPGGAHAEVVALRQAGSKAQGATAYVTLEPCPHHGRTSPCTDALIDAGIARVVVALEDPDEHARGAGIARLRDAKIEVDVGVGARETERSLAPYLHHRRTGRPYVVAKLATSSDHRVPTGGGAPTWVTGLDARADGHDLRADSQAIVIGSGTALADHPHLTPRDAQPPLPANPPLRVLFDARGRVPAQGPLFDVALAPTLVITTDEADASTVKEWIGCGAQVERVPAQDRGVDLKAALEVLGKRDVVQVLVEGGPTLQKSLLSAGLVDRLVIYRAPRALVSGGIIAPVIPDDFVLRQRNSIAEDLRLDFERLREG